jgi:tetratricopeptide (TPR) repeat protein
LDLALEIAGYLLWEGDKMRTQAAAAEKQIASAVHDRHPDVADQLRRKKDDVLAKAQRQYQEALDYYVTALRRSNHPELCVPSHPLRDEVLVGLADLYYFNLDRPDLAAEHYQKLIGTEVVPEIAIHARLMLGEIHFSKGDWLGAERALRQASKLSVLAVSELPGRGAETGLRKLSQLATAVKGLCATYKRAWALARLGRTVLARKVFRDCVSAKKLKHIVGSGAAAVRRACAADERRLYP